MRGDTSPNLEDSLLRPGASLASLVEGTGVPGLTALREGVPATP